MAQQTQQPIRQINHQTQQPATAQLTAAGLVTVHGGSQHVNLQRVTFQQTYTQKEARSAVALGVIQLLVGLLCITFQSAATWIQRRYYRTIGQAESAGAGIWCGLMFFVTGLLGIASGKKNSKALIISFMVFNVFASVLVWVLIGFEIGQLATLNSVDDIQITRSMSASSIRNYYYVSVKASATALSSNRYNYFHYQMYFYDQQGYPTYGTYYYPVYVLDSFGRYSSPYSAWLAMDSMLLILGFLEFAVAIAASSYCCKALACCCTQPEPAYSVQQSSLSPHPAGAYTQGVSTQPMSVNQGSATRQRMAPSGVMQSEPYGAVWALPNYATQTSATPQGLQPGILAGSSGDGIEMTATGFAPPANVAYHVQAHACNSSEFTNLTFAPPSYEDVRNEDMRKAQRGQGASS